VLQNNRYIVILDDVWDKLAWKHVKCALVENFCSSRIITTTRIHDVAVSCCSEVDGTVYKLQNLSYYDSKKIFYKRIFGFEDNFHPELQEMSDKILKKCGGVPLAINTIASILANSSRNIKQWHDVYNSIGSGLEKSQILGNMRNILSISYYGLPSHLKACLLYLSMYPEDYSILGDQLIRRWISEGFVQGEDVVTSYEIGEKYFTELINRSLIEPDHIDPHGKVLSCQLHDMVLDLLTSLSCEENFITALHDRKSTNVPKTIRRLSVQTSTDGHAILKASNLSHVRSLIVFPRAANLLPPLSSFYVLRVLDFEGCHNLESYQIDGVATLFHLRSLILKDTNIESLPKEIGKLGYLQTLDLRNTNISELPSTVVQLSQLLRLYIDRSVIVPAGFEGMKSLQALSHIGICKSPSTKELGCLTELRILHISISGVWYASNEKSLMDSLCNLKRLHELCIVGGVISKLPRWIKSRFLCLGSLDLKLGQLLQEDLQNLGALSCLYDLSLTVVGTGSQRLVVGTDQKGFQSLVKFSFSCNTMRLIFTQQAMPRLEYLELVFRIQETRAFNVGLENLPSLKYVRTRIDCMGCRGNVVEHVDAAIRKAACANSNHPRLDVIRYFDNAMDRDDEKLQVHDEIEETEEEVI
jgi:Leucine-rich repeat (LRR) protein